MRGHRSVTSPVTLPIVVEAFDSVFERRIIFEETIHADNFKNVTQERTHACQFEIAVQVPQKLQPFEENPNAQIIQNILSFKSKLISLK